ncbi:MAG: PD-(D/E)XK nuclease family protein, partial [Planctomycetota bacterium]
IKSRAGIVWKFRNNLQEEAEELRVLYVGATRAKDLLVLTATVKEGEMSGDSWLGKIFAALNLSLEPGDRELQLPPDENGVSPGMRVRITDAAQTSPAPAQDSHGEDRARVPVSQVLSALSKEKPANIPPMLAGLDADTSGKKGFSATELAIYDYCPRKYYYQTICGYPEQYGERKFTSKERALSPAMFGTIAHEVFEELDFRNPPPREKIIETIRKYSFPDEKTEEKAADDIENIVGIFLETPFCKELRGAKGVEREIPFLMRLNGAGIEGIIDLLYERDDGAVCVVDYKSNNVPDGNFAGEARGYEAQLAAYALAAKRILKKPAAPPRIYFMRYGRLEEVVTDGGPEQCLERIIENIRNGRFDRIGESADCRCGFTWLCKTDGACH